MLWHVCPEGQALPEPHVPPRAQAGLPGTHAQPSDISEGLKMRLHDIPIPQAEPPHCGTVPTDHQPVAVVLDFVDPIGARQWLCSFNRLGGDNEPGWKTFDFHVPA